MVTFEAGLAQSAGAQFFVDPTALSFRIEASSLLRLTALSVKVNSQDITSRLMALGRLSVTADGASGSLVAERLSFVGLGIAAATAYRVAATVSDASGATTVEATLSPGAGNTPLATTAPQDADWQCAPNNGSCEGDSTPVAARAMLSKPASM